MPTDWIEIVARRQVLRDGELERRLVLEVVEHLHRALAEGLLPDDDGAVVVLERAGDDLRGRGAAAVDQHHHRIVAARCLPPCADLLLALAVALADRDDERPLRR